MSKPKYATRLPQDLDQVISTARDDLRAFIDEQRGIFAEMSERWQEGEKGEAIAAWLDELEIAADAMDAIPDTAEA